jgi:hypothetical protein
MGERLVWTALACGLSLAACVPKPAPKPDIPPELRAELNRSMMLTVVCMSRRMGSSQTALQSADALLDQVMDCDQQARMVDDWLASSCGVVRSTAQRRAAAGGKRW